MSKILNIHGEETVYVTAHDEPCDRCKTIIKCYQGENGGVITYSEGKGYHLWGQMAVCNRCNEIMYEEFKVAIEKIQEEYNAT